MANTISQFASVYPQKRETAQSVEDRSGVKSESVASSAPVANKPPVPESKGPDPVKQQEELINQRNKENATDRTEELAAKLKKLPQMIQRNLEFSVHDETGRPVVRVIDAETGDLVRQIPQEQVLRIISQLQDAQESASTGTGMLFDERM